MATSGSGAFSSDEAREYLKELAEKAPGRRAAALESLFQSVKHQPESAGRGILPDQVVAAAAIVAAPALGGKQFDEGLQALADDDPALDARLPMPVLGMAGAALTALDSVADRWRQARSNDAAGASRTIDALSQVLAHVGAMDDLDLIWNDACDYGAEGDVPEGTPAGIQHLASLLRIHGSVMGGGLAFALEVNEPFRVRRAVEALHYFGLTASAELLDDTLQRSLRGEASASWPTSDNLDGLIDGDLVDSAFRVKATEVPGDFGRV